MDYLLKCPGCASYGLSAACPCGKTRVSPVPAKFSPEDKYGSYRRRAKELLREEGSAGSAVGQMIAAPKSSPLGHVPAPVGEMPSRGDIDPDRDTEALEADDDVTGDSGDGLGDRDS